MKKILLFFLSIFSAVSLNAQQTFTVTNAGFAFNPSTVTVSQGDIVHFNLSASHPVLQVSQATWTANGSTALSGGFSFPSGIGDYTAGTPGTYYYVCSNHVSSFGMKGTIVVNAITGIRDIHLRSEVRLYPNPAVDWLILQTEGNLMDSEVTIFDITGKTVMLFKKPESSGDGMRIDIGSLNTGIYFVRVKSDSGIVSGKFLKSKI
ncbi:MAG: T9SS type A sorting domain-containing protein [Bacteroidetes bacterium]|nr:MAG: T9SS type A sorting domain-containing protein [Bacteroidota bacterium]